MGEALRSVGAQVDVLDPVMETRTLTLNAFGKGVRKMGLTDPMLNRSRAIARWKAWTLQKRLKGNSYDALLAPVGSTLIAELSQDVPPIIYSSDATIPLMESYYNGYGKVHSWYNKRAKMIEKAALNRADLLVYPTWWAAYSAMDDYDIYPDRILVQPFGANISDPPTREQALAPRKPGPLRLLFCGVEWERKGGDIALDAVRALIAAGTEVELTILGVEPPVGALDDPDLARAVTVVPFLNKTIAEERARFREIFMEADILILPTQAECYGMVFCEAAACGTASFATATGGVPEVILDKETGRVLAPDSTGQDYANAILELINSEGAVQQMRSAARNDYDTRLNWQTWGKAVLERTEAVLRSAPRIDHVAAE